MRLGRLKVELRSPVWFDLIKPYWCDSCQRFRSLERKDGRCPECLRGLRRTSE